MRAEVIVRHPTILHALRDAAHAGATVTVRPGAGRPSEVLSVAEVSEIASRSATRLVEVGVRRGDRIVVSMPTALDAVTAFFAVQLVGAIPVPYAAPAYRRCGDGAIATLCDYVRPAAVIAPGGEENFPAGVRAAVLDTADLYEAGRDESVPAVPWQPPIPAACAVIQCTSGSTGQPQGVQVSHANLAANCEQIVEFASWTAEDTSVSWLPLYHDMGLIGGLLAPMFAGADTVLLPPNRFLRAPVEWLRAVHEHRGVISATPNFGLSYAVRRVAEHDVRGLDLSSWRMIFCGAEPVSIGTVQRFVDHFAPARLAGHSVIPCYGLAEAGLMVTAAAPGQIGCDVVSRRELACTGDVVDVEATDSDAMEVVALGPPVRGNDIRVVDDAGVPLAEDRLGRVQFRGPSCTTGYFERPAATMQRRAAGGWWDTGDLGYLRDGCLRITGRSRDTIIIRGANYFAVDFEQIAESLPGVKPGAVAAVAHRASDADTDQLWMIIEAEVPESDTDEFRRALVGRITERTGVAVARTVLIPNGGLPKTTSGKLRRRDAYLRVLAEDSVVGRA